MTQDGGNTRQHASRARSHHRTPAHRIQTAKRRFPKADRMCARRRPSVSRCRRPVARRARLRRNIPRQAPPLQDPAGNGRPVQASGLRPETTPKLVSRFRTVPGDAARRVSTPRTNHKGAKTLRKGTANMVPWKVNREDPAQVFGITFGDPSFSSCTPHPSKHLATATGGRQTWPSRSRLSTVSSSNVVHSLGRIPLQRFSLCGCISFLLRRFFLRDGFRVFPKQAEKGVSCFGRHRFCGVSFPFVRAP